MTCVSGEAVARRRRDGAWAGSPWEKWMTNERTAEPEILRNAPVGLEAPIPSDDEGVWGSDVAAEMMRALDIPYVALNPGASFRGLHDSLVNKLGNRRPQMLLCLHE